MHGADKNALIRGTPMVEHLLAWSPVKALTALRFLVRGTWGNLLVTRRIYIDRVIAMTHNWPPAIAGDFFNDMLGFMAPRHEHETQIYQGLHRLARADGGPVHCGCQIDWDAHIVQAIEALHAPALAELVRRRPADRPNDSFSPINALRRLLLQMELPMTLDGRKTKFRAWKIAAEMWLIIQDRYPDHRFDVSRLLARVSDSTILQLRTELEISVARFNIGGLSAKGFAIQVQRLMMPFLGIAAGCSDLEMSRLEVLIGSFVPEEAKIRIAITRRTPAKEGLDMEMICEDEDARVSWSAGVEEMLQLDCEVWG